MSRIQSIAKQMGKGYSIRRSFWRKGLCVYMIAESMSLQFKDEVKSENWTPTISDLLATDWSIAEGKISRAVKKAIKDAKIKLIERKIEALQGKLDELLER